MTALKLPPPLLAVLAVGAVWWLTQRRAVAASGYTASPASSSATAQRYMVSPNSPGTSAQAAPVTPLQAGLQFLTSLVQPATPRQASTNLAAAYSLGGPSTGVYGVDAGIVRPADYVPTYTPDTAGEAAAQAYYLSNPDEFIANPPVYYTPYTGDNSSGWLDSQ